MSLDSTVGGILLNRLQDLFTVVPSEDQTEAAFANSTSQCRVAAVRDSWATPKNQTLDVELVGTAGTMSPNGWPPSCESEKTMSAVRRG